MSATCEISLSCSDGGVIECTRFSNEGFGRGH